jgi:phosphoglycolate phosphatase-like HAD superfamily hydrolase
MRSSLLLWDVDGTLVRTGALGREPFQAAVASVLGGGAGVDPLLHEQVQMSGKTDPQIARELLALAAVSEDDVEHHLPEVLRRLEAGLGELEERIGREGEVLPGVVTILERCSAMPGVVSTVLTGNLAANALVKLRAFGLDRWLDLRIGAYGSDHHDREELVPIAMAKASAAHGRDFSASEAWVIGDTPRDLACARAGGARCALVATGKFDRAALDACGPDVVFDDLRDTELVLAALGVAP